MRRSELTGAQALCAQYLDPARPVLAAVSGGADSMCLLHFLCAQGYTVFCAHFNHRLRGADSERDEQFVRVWCRERAIPFYAGSGDVRAHARANGQSIEEAARILRYAFLRETAERLGAQLALAHHLDDNAETVLLNLIRGTDLRGLCGMKPLQDGLVRPLLTQTRAELLAYAAENAIPYVSDATNDDPDAAARNYLRLEILPRLKTLNSRASEHIAAAARSLVPLDGAIARETDALMQRAQRSESCITLPLDAFRAAGEGVQPRILLAMADALGAGRKDISRAQLEAACALAQRAGSAERQFALAHGLRLLCASDTLTMVLVPAAPREAALVPAVPLPWGNYTLTLLPSPEGEGLVLRAPREGETLTAAACEAGAHLRLAGANGARSIKRLCIDHHIPPLARDALPALYLGGRLAAVWPLGADASFLPHAGEETCFVRVEKIPEHSAAEHRAPPRG